MRAKTLLASLTPGAATLLSLGLLGLGCDMDDDDPLVSLPGRDAGSVDAGEHVALPTGLQVMTDGEPTPADLACLGRRNQPSGAARTSSGMPAFSFGQVDSEGKRVTIADLEIQMFTDNRIPASSACEDGCTLATHEGDGIYTIESSDGGWLAYRVLERAASGDAPRVMRSIEVNVLPDPNESLHTVLAPVMDGLHMALAIPRDPARTIVAGRFFDCNGDLVEGATIALRDTEGEPIATDEQTRVLYLDAMGPDPTLRRTPFTGQWSVTNVPVGSGQVVVEARAENGVLVACELAATAPDTLSVIRLHPLRADAPSLCAASSASSD